MKKHSLLMCCALPFLVTACQDQGDNGHNAVAETHAPPAWEEIGNTTFPDIDGASVTFTNGRWQGKPYVEGGASAPSAGLVEDFAVSGDIDGDGQQETVVLLWSSSGGSGTFNYVAVMGRDRDGNVMNIGTLPLGDRVQVISAEIAEGQVRFLVNQAGPGDAACCPGQKARRTFELSGDKMAELPVEEQGRLSLADLEGEWVLVGFSGDEEVAPEIEITLQVAAGRIAGKAACNRYNGSLSEGGSPGEIHADGPMAATRMMCPPQIMDAEQRYLHALQNVAKYSFVAGKLVLSWSAEDEAGRLWFRRLSPVRSE